jgi:hypothetical protein
LWTAAVRGEAVSDDGYSRLSGPSPLGEVRGPMVAHRGYRARPVMPETVEKRVIRRGRAVFPGRSGRGARPLIDWRARFARGDQVLIAAISGPTPKIVIIRLRL